MNIICDYSAYFKYLIGIIGISIDDLLIPNLIRLFERGYYWKNPIDGALKGHVEELRANAIRYGKLSPIDIPTRDASVLEVLISLGILVDLRLLYDSENPGGNVSLYFMDFIEGLGLDCDNELIDSAIDSFLDGEVRIAEIGETLWQQCNAKYRETFDIMTDE